MRSERIGQKICWNMHRKILLKKYLSKNIFSKIYFLGNKVQNMVVNIGSIIFLHACSPRICRKRQWFGPPLDNPFIGLDAKNSNCSLKPLGLNVARCRLRFTFTINCLLCGNSNSHHNNIITTFELMYINNLAGDEDRDRIW